ncbi:Zn2 DNA-binding protein [Venustampulla echinocandica]|uniref:Zn2 DNA-binding protein n=1 Tax=Venustampulla echinocandica TaxID=2656787 RepID=A0A370TJD8_9HELO|nr:Zn2 DNA-binding protein [Venustampulla echinocandica]RDL35460.1 Zn2 DNA-binding protein [Venustampulla echinocandica]
MNPAGDNGPPRPPSPLKPPRKRKRIVISCTECHRRKQKCDRSSPCSNCIARNKQSLCHYENESARKQQLLEEKNTAAATSLHGGAFSVIRPNDPDRDADTDTAAQVTAFGYAKSNGNINTTLGIFKKIEKHDAGESSLLAHPAAGASDQSGLREKYKSLIRQLPSKPYIEQLLPTYFREVNYQYYPLDEGIFRDHLQNWYNLSFSTLNKGPLELSGELQFFPALLFQCLALALQFQPLDYDKGLDSLKYAAGMSFDDLASDYSESGVAILNLLGKRNTTLLTVQAGFLRTAYLKNVGMVTEGWHSLSSTIRDAQEIGLHREGVSKPRRPDEKAEDILEGLWVEQLRRRMWLILALWDIHMAINLGRPATIDPRDGTPPFPIDAPTPKSRREAAPSPRAQSDPPTPLTMLLWNVELSAPLWDIFNLEKEDPNQNNLAKVEKMHNLIRQIAFHCPPFFRAHNPDTSFDADPGCYWLPRAREVFKNGAAFTIMALHRPYIFTSPSSRTAALKAGLDILLAQRAFFGMLSSLHYKMFALVLNTFDAIVLVAAIYILHPHENSDDLDDSLRHFEWGMERFQIMSTRNTMAKAALGVLKAIHLRLKRALSPPKSTQIQTESGLKTQSSPLARTPETYPCLTTNGQYLTPSTHHQSISSASSTSTTDHNNAPTPATVYTLPTISNLTSPSAVPTPLSSNSASWGTGNITTAPGDFAPIPLAPLHPMHDLVFNDLGTAMDSGYETGTWDVTGIDVAGEEDMSAARWQFEGDFGSDSFWGLMNTYSP